MEHTHSYRAVLNSFPSTIQLADAAAPQPSLRVLREAETVFDREAEQVAAAARSHGAGVQHSPGSPVVDIYNLRNEDVASLKVSGVARIEGWPEPQPP